MANMRRRWTMRLRDDTGREHVWSVEVPDDGSGCVYARTDGGPRYVLEPLEISKLRRVWQEAQFVALIDRDRF